MIALMDKITEKSNAKFPYPLRGFKNFGKNFCCILSLNTIWEKTTKAKKNYIKGRISKNIIMSKHKYNMTVNSRRFINFNKRKIIR